MNKTYLLYHIRKLAVVLATAFMILAAYFLLFLFSFRGITNMKYSGGIQYFIEGFLKTPTFIIVFSMIIAFVEQRMHLNNLKTQTMRFWLTKPMTRKEYIMLKIFDSLVYSLVSIILLSVVMKFCGVFELSKVLNYTLFLMASSFLATAFSLSFDTPMYAFFLGIFSVNFIIWLPRGINLYFYAFVISSIMFICASLYYLRKDLKK